MASQESAQPPVKAWAAAQRSLGLVKHASTSTKAAGNMHFKSRMFGTALFHYHSAAFSIHGTGVCMLVDVASPPIADSIQDSEALLLLAELKNVRANRPSFRLLPVHSPAHAQVLNNAAVCLLKLDHADKAIACCCAVLQWLDPSDRKAAYRLVLASQPPDAPVPEVTDATYQQGQELAQANRSSQSCHECVQGLLRACKDVWVAARPAESAAMKAAATESPPHAPSALKATATAANPVSPHLDAASALLLSQLQNVPPLPPLSSNGNTRDSVPMPLSSAVACSSLEESCFADCGGTAAAKCQFKAEKGHTDGIAEAWHMVWLFPSPSAAQSFASTTLSTCCVEPQGKLPSFMEGIPIAKAQLLPGSAGAAPPSLAKFDDGMLPAGTVAGLGGAVHTGNSAGIPQAALSSMPPALVAACGGAAWFAPGVVLLCAVGSVVHKVWLGGVKCDSGAPAEAALPALQAHMEMVLLPSLLHSAKGTAAQ